MTIILPTSSRASKPLSSVTALVLANGHYDQQIASGSIRVFDVNWITDNRSETELLLHDLTTSMRGINGIEIVSAECVENRLVLLTSVPQTNGKRLRRQVKPDFLLLVLPEDEWERIANS